jgi:hypothetical protein
LILGSVLFRFSGGPAAAPVLSLDSLISVGRVRPTRSRSTVSLCDNSLFQ